MRQFVFRLVNRARLWLFSISEIARFEGIVLVHLGRRRDELPLFRDTVLAALRLIQEADPIRFARIQRHITWVVNVALVRGGAEYHHAIRACMMEFNGGNLETAYLVGQTARTLVHEATHGRICSWGIPYKPELRERIERLCVREEQRFLRLLAVSEPDLAVRLRREFDPALWNWHWTSTPLERASIVLTRLFE